MNMNTFELYGSNREDLIEIDDLIAPTIQLLNRKNYITSASCSGHAEREPSNGYIQFDFGEMTPEILPKGWYWEADGLNNTSPLAITSAVFLMSRNEGRNHN
ncbi:MAG: hypothetical protein IJH05_00030 [Firmicutes bacterium]|nr:hypothetical protein [Bacillota bacterium]